jgi:hypothetical protein
VSIVMNAAIVAAVTGRPRTAHDDVAHAASDDRQARMTASLPIEPCAGTSTISSKTAHAWSHPVTWYVTGSSRATSVVRTMRARG